MFSMQNNPHRKRNLIWKCPEISDAFWKHQHKRHLLSEAQETGLTRPDVGSRYKMHCFQTTLLSVALRGSSVQYALLNMLLSWGVMLWSEGFWCVLPPSAWLIVWKHIIVRGLSRTELLSVLLAGPMHFSPTQSCTLWSVVKLESSLICN